MINYRDDSLTDVQRLEAYRGIINRLLFGPIPAMGATYALPASDAVVAARIIGQMLDRLTDLPEAQALGLAYAAHLTEFYPRQAQATHYVVRRLMLDRDMFPHACDLALQLVDPLGNRVNRGPLIKLVDRALSSAHGFDACHDKAMELALCAAKRINRADATLGTGQDLEKITGRVFAHATSERAEHFLNIMRDHWIAQGFTFADPLADLVDRVLKANPAADFVLPWAISCLEHAKGLPCRQSVRRMAITLMHHKLGGEEGYAASLSLFLDLKREGTPQGWAISLAEEMLKAEHGSIRSIDFARQVATWITQSGLDYTHQARGLLGQAIDCSQGSDRAALWLIREFRASSPDDRLFYHGIFNRLAEKPHAGDGRLLALVAYIADLSAGTEAVYTNRLADLLRRLSPNDVPGHQDSTLRGFGVSRLKMVANRSVLSRDFKAAADALWDIHGLTGSPTTHIEQITHTINDKDGTPRVIGHTLGGTFRGRAMPRLTVFPDHTPRTDGSETVIRLDDESMSRDAAMQRIAHDAHTSKRFRDLAKQILENS